MDKKNLLKNSFDKSIPDILNEVQAIAKIGHWEFDLKTREMFWSDQLYKLIGYDPKMDPPDVGELAKFIFEEDFEHWNTTLQKCFKDGEPYIITTRVINPFQGIVWLEFRGRGLFDLNGEKIIKLRGTIQDVTYLKLKEIRLQKAIKEAKKLSHSKDLFLANMSHEIRTPLNGILGMTELLLASIITEEQRKFLKIIKNSGQSLLEIINDVLDLSKVESGLLKVNKREFVLEEMMNNLYYLFLNLAEGKGVGLHFNVDKKISYHLQGDEMKLRQILTNLIGNALKFTSEGEVVVGANVIDVHEKHLFIRFSVKDTGLGIDQEKVGDSIFQPFVQEGREGSESFRGTGLGLSISSQLAELLGGSLDYKSSIDQGAEFWFTLGFDIVEQKHSDTSVIKEGRKNLAPSELKVLIVEDNSVNRLIISKFLQRLKIEHEEAASGSEALEKIKKKNYDLVFMDLKMPILSGFETTEKIRELKLVKEPKIVALTANAFEEDKGRCFELGMFDFLTKPVSFDRFTALIDKVHNAL